MGNNHDNQSENALLNGGYEQMIAKPPLGISGWSLDKIVLFKDAVGDANLALARAIGGSRSSQIRFLKKAEVVMQFYVGGSDAD